MTLVKHLYLLALNTVDPKTRKALRNAAEAIEAMEVALSPGRPGVPQTCQHEWAGDSDDLGRYADRGLSVCECGHPVFQHTPFASPTGRPAGCTVCDCTATDFPLPTGTAEQAAPYRIGLVLDGWAWSKSDLDKTVAHLHGVLRSHQTPDTGATVSLVSMSWSTRV